jgi:hypothetical protein
MRGAVGAADQVVHRTVRISVGLDGINTVRNRTFFFKEASVGGLPEAVVRSVRHLAVSGVSSKQSPAPARRKINVQ